jgi:hypothetical protein
MTMMSFLEKFSQSFLGLHDGMKVISVIFSTQRLSYSCLPKGFEKEEAQQLAKVKRHNGRERGNKSCPFQFLLMTLTTILKHRTRTMMIMMVMGLGCVNKALPFPH